ncbi:MAG: enoyl-CoA hydratase/isomerase family protein [Acidimicrobiia bacterium]
MPGLRVETPVDGVALVSLDRPERLNALDDELLEHALADGFTSLRDDPAVRVIVITGKGRGFSSGADLECSGFQQPSSTAAEEHVRHTHRTPVILRKIGKPTIAAVNGVAIGAGLGLALACDLRLAAPTARFGAPFVAMGLVPDYGVSYFLPRVVGTATALDMLLTGRLVGAEEALKLGIVSRIEGDVVSAAVELATQIAVNPVHATATTRSNVYRSLELDIEAEILEQEPRAQALALFGPEFHERFAEYTEKIMSS